MARKDDEQRWAAWKEETFGSPYMIWHDGLSVSSVTWLRGGAADEGRARLQAIAPRAN